MKSFKVSWQEMFAWRRSRSLQVFNLIQDAQQRLCAFGAETVVAEAEKRSVSRTSIRGVDLCKSLPSTTYSSSVSGMPRFCSATASTCVPAGPILFHRKLQRKCVRMKRSNQYDTHHSSVTTMLPLSATAISTASASVRSHPEELDRKARKYKNEKGETKSETDRVTMS